MFNLKKNFLIVPVLLLLAACRSAPPSPTPVRLFQGPTVVLPTLPPTSMPTPTSTLVMANPWTPTPVPTSTPLPEELLGLVTQVVDAKTVAVVLAGDSPGKVYRVRLLGVEPPANTPAEPWGQVAYEQLQAWLSGQVVRLVQDQTVIDEEGLLPRYVYLDDALINLRLVEQGLARVRFQAPDTTLESEFQAAAQAAQAGQRGLWGGSPTATPTVTPTLTPTLAITATSTLTTTP